MIIMPANNSKWCVHYWQGLYGGLGHLYSPGSHKGPWPHLPYALDNGAFPAWTNGTEWDEAAWMSHLDFYLRQEQQPIWILVPDVVADKTATIAKWNHYEPRIRSHWHIPLCLAFAVQDGMQPGDVPKGVEVVFVGGTTDWKWGTIDMWCAEFPRVHVGRVNGYDGLVRCAIAGAESCDGTGWFRGDKRQLAGLQRFLCEQSSGKPADFTIPRQRAPLMPAGCVQETLFQGNP